MKLVFFLIFIFLAPFFVYSSFAENINVYATVDRKSVSVGDAITLTIYVQGTQSVNTPQLPDIDGFQERYMGASRQISIVNNQSSVSIIHRYMLLAEKTGNFTIPSVTVEYEGKTYRTEPVSVQVVSGSGQLRSQARTADDLKRYIRLDISTKRKTAYLNEGIPLMIRMYISSEADVRDIRYPSFPSAGFSVLPFDEPNQRQAVIGGIIFRVIDFTATVYPVTTGELTLGPAEANCNIIVTTSRSPDPFFDQRVRYGITVKSDPYTITVKPLPESGKPESFSGAVGQYDLNAAAKPTSLKVGEPITLTMTVKGQGNIDMVNMPKISGLDEFKVYDPQVNVKKEGNSGEKTFEQVLIPKSLNVKAIPEIKFSYFDPETERYITKIKGPIPIQVSQSDTAEPLQILEVAEGKAVRSEVLGRDIVYIRDEIGAISHGDGYLYKSKGFLLLQLVPLMGIGGVLAYQRRRNRFAADRAYARQYHAPRKANKGLAQARKLMEAGRTEEFCAAVFKTMQIYLGDRFDLPFAGITIEIVDVLRSRVISEEAIEKLSTFFQACDTMRFAGAGVSEDEMSKVLDMAIESIRLLRGDGRF